MGYKSPFLAVKRRLDFLTDFLLFTSTINLMKQFGSNMDIPASGGCLEIALLCHRSEQIGRIEVPNIRTRLIEPVFFQQTLLVRYCGKIVVQKRKVLHCHFH